ncbi:hypothetical protein ACQP00_05760 [Dactylosporangium sp. CS-047395]|uniref:hypothetical protein n=1 Tax=Dactylosporangium sp. CS-047395 TaxID=3239936 RepID=UPI003D95024B
MRFGPSGEARLLTRFVLMCAPLFLIESVFGVYVATGDPDLFWRVLSTLAIGTGVVFALVGPAVIVMESRRGRSAGPDGIKLFGRTLPWSDITKISLHAGVKNRELVAAWPHEKAPVWLGDVKRASVPRDEALHMLEAWSGRRIEE